MSVSKNSDDSYLISQIQNNELEAFDVLFNKYRDRLYRFAFSLLKDAEDSKEIVQEAFFRIWKKRNEIDSTKSFKSFLFSISYNLIVDELRLRLKDQEYRKFLQTYFESRKFELANNFDYDSLVEQVRHAVDELPAKRKQIYTLSREVGLSHKEIAERMGVTVKTVENQITLALKHLKKRLGKDIIPIVLFLSLFA